MSDDLTPLLEEIEKLNTLEHDLLAKLVEVQSVLIDRLLRLEEMCPTEGREN
jgi:hypothetical protein